MNKFLRDFWRLLRMAAVASYRNDAFGIAKGVAYSGLLSFFPVMTTIAALLVQTHAEQTAQTITSFLSEVAPPGTERLIVRLFVVNGSRPVYLLVTAVLLAAWAASGAIITLMSGFQTAYHIPSGRSFFKERGMAILLVFVSIVPLWIASVLIVFGAAAERFVFSDLTIFSKEVSGWAAIGGQAVRYGIALAALVFSTAIVYYLGPNRKQSFRLVLPGAVLATIISLVATLAVGWYLRHVTNYNVLYGSVGAGLALLVWMYVLGVVVLFGCEFNAALERERFKSG
ncbi:MAG: YihY/virulence factor BrkB family protein [Bryobacterales bacterium]|nr:YihY/virulence factor BrkB family protein [Bryobacterales bacterium]